MGDLDEINSLLRYEPDSGTLFWKVDRRYGVMAGDSCTTISNYGYIVLKIRGKQYLAHRVAWLISYGEWPLMEVDHIDGNRTNNSLNNLRMVSRQMNMKNKRKRSDCPGVTGVRWHNNARRWSAHIGDNGKQISKYFTCLLDAVAERYRLEKSIGYTERHGR
ncbi:HNH endonuclease [Pseudomonas sp. FP1742]|uniref:HNH endonuclease n=1 Tax=Pseudomonas sp. FP1742 TaxID=2954079 RepID=UPI00273356BA|nr:HNH endonuclease [Pseudomonas sp. FP1742]WLG49168.1 HNH endonuclease [Pseudomonas sp. FP1742]